MGKTRTAKRTANNQARQGRRTTEFAPVPGTPWHWYILLLVAFLAALAVFSPSLNGTLIFDDFNLPFSDPLAAGKPPGFWIGGSRPVLMLTYWINFLLAGTAPFVYHVTNLLLHAVNAVLVFFIAGRIFAISNETDSSADMRWPALFVAAIFLLHPLQTESVDYIAGRSEIVSGSFFLAGWLVFLHGFEGTTGFGRALAICLLAGLGIKAKESAIGLPLVLVATDLYFSGGTVGEWLTRRFRLYLLFLFGGTAAAFQILSTLSAASGAGFASGISPFRYGLTQCRAILTYLRLFVLPDGQNGDWQLPLYRSLTDGAASLWAIALLLLIVVAVALRRKKRIISYGIIVFLVILAPTSSFIPVKDALAERRMYLAMVGLALMLPAMFVRFDRRWRLAAACGAVLACSAVAYDRSHVWVGPFEFWRDSAAVNPANPRAHFGLGAAMVARRDCAGAVREFSLARTQPKNNPTIPPNQITWNLAEAYLCQKKPAEALPLYRAVAAAEPSAKAYAQIGYAEGLQGRFGAALEALEQALKLEPDNVKALTLIGITRTELNDNDGARKAWTRVLQLAPGDRTASQGLASLDAPAR